MKESLIHKPTKIIINIKDEIEEIKSHVDMVLLSTQNINIKIKQLKQIEESYKPLLRELAHKNTIEEINSIIAVFEGLAHFTKTIGKLTGNLKYYTDTAVLYQYIATIIEQKTKPTGLHAQISKENLYEELSGIKQSLLSAISNNKSTTINIKDLKQEIEENKSILYKLRLQTSNKIKEIENYLKFSKTPENIYSIEEREILYVTGAKNLFVNIITLEMKEFLAKLYKDSEQEIHSPPCSYAVIGLGSLALEQITPYSDLEFAILTENSEYKGHSDIKIREYFKNLTHLVSFKIINLGETVIHISKYNTNLDHLVCKGVNIDLGGKSPLGREEEDKPYELIGTVEYMLWYVYNKYDRASRIDKNLPNILEKVCYVYGDEKLIIQYQTAVSKFLFKERDSDGNLNCEARAIRILQKGTIEFNCPNISNTHSVIQNKGDLEKFRPLFKINGELFDIKQNIYRLPDRLLYNIGLYYGIDKGNAWDTIEQLRVKELISTEASIHLKYAITFATLLRLKGYLHAKSQKEDMSIFPSSLSDSEQNNYNIEIFHLSKDDLEEDGNLFKYFYIVLPLHQRIEEFCEQHKSLNEYEKKEFFKYDKFYTNNSINKGLIHFRLLHYHEAQINFEKALENSENHSNFHIIRILGHIYNNLGDLKRSQKHWEYCLDNIALSQHNLAVALYELGNCYNIQGMYKEAQRYCYESLKNFYQIYHHEKNQYIVSALSLLGSINCNMNYFVIALEFTDNIQEMLKIVYNKNSHIDIACVLCTLGENSLSVGEIEKAASYFIQSINMYNAIYKGEPHPNVALALNNLGLAYIEHGRICNEIGEYKLAQNSYELVKRTIIKSLYMLNIIYKDNSHPLIAQALKYLGIYCHFIGDLEKALECHINSIKMQEQINNTLDVSAVLHIQNLVLEEYKKTRALYIESSNILRDIFFEKGNLDITLSLCFLGRIKTYYQYKYQQTLEYFSASKKEISYFP
ncbi:Tetratricopeptide repeat containing protein (plasmid) [Candidatus Trichorickettsia mobilis]|uniref:hypothetical protein n=1 Tax=Candidatus Trichorickettsia mobilis TaxID=1346319 RepID=UPI002B2579A4|nr:hypothetical protein [Candidatus Trichorickettsia mobilis]WPY01808.1 Tetratricopeptide repeat containing protein [Candidatus Trichorickettsia mobilis]